MKQSYTQFALTALLSVAMFFSGILSASSQQFLTQINGMNAYVHLPDDYATTSVKYPVIVFITGLGEIGTDPKKLLLFGPSYFVSKGHNMQFTVNGKVEKPIVISLQSKTAWPRPETLKKCYDSIMIRYRADAERLYLTGLSMGGWAANNFIGFSQEYASRPAAIVAMSSPASTFPLSNYKWFAQTGGKWWGLEGNTDQRGNTKTRDTLNKYKAGSARYTQYIGGHCCWNTFYDPTWTENGESIYTWLLKQRRGGAQAPVVLPVPDSTPVANQAPVSFAGNDITAAESENSANLSGRGTDNDGTISKYEWKIVSSPYVGTISNRGTPTTTVTGLVEGRTTICLTVTDNKGATAISYVTVTVNPKPAVNATATQMSSTTSQGTESLATPKAAGGFVNDLRKEKEYVIYPNPVSDVLRVKYVSVRREGNGKVKTTISDAMGRLVYTSTDNSPFMLFEKKVPVAQLRSGMYFITLAFADGEISTKSFVKQ